MRDTPTIDGESLQRLAAATRYVIFEGDKEPPLRCVVAGVGPFESAGVMPRRGTAGIRQRLFEATVLDGWMQRIGQELALLFGHARHRHEQRGQECLGDKLAVTLGKEVERLLVALSDRYNQ